MCLIFVTTISICFLKIAINFCNDNRELKQVWRGRRRKRYIKGNSRCFRLHRACSNMLANLELNSKGLHLRLQKETENRCLIIFTLCRGDGSVHIRTYARAYRRKMFN